MSYDLPIKAESKLAAKADIYDFLDLSQDMTEEEGRYGLMHKMAVGGEPLEEIYMRSLLLGRKIALKWKKKRLLQIGMFEDSLRIMGVLEAYNMALREELRAVQSKLAKYEVEVTVNETITGTGQEEHSVEQAA